MRAKHQVLFVQGAGADTHDAWDNKLVASLQHALGRSYEILYPRMPNEAEPSYAPWKKALDGLFEKLQDGAILVGHSVGGTILLKALSELQSKRTFGALISIAAPFVGDGGWSNAELQLPGDLGARLPRALPIQFFHGVKDETAPLSHVELYAKAIPQARIHRLPDRDHQLNDDLREVASAILSLVSS